MFLRRMQPPYVEEGIFTFTLNLHIPFYIAYSSFYFTSPLHLLVLRLSSSSSVTTRAENHTECASVCEMNDRMSEGNGKKSTSSDSYEDTVNRIVKR